MNLPERIRLLSRLGDYILANSDEWQDAQELAIQRNAWFTPEHVSLAANNIAGQFLDKEKLESWVSGLSVAGYCKEGGDRDGGQYSARRFS